MEVKFTGFIDPSNNSPDKKITQSQDEFSAIFSALLLNILPKLSPEQSVEDTASQENSSVSSMDFNVGQVQREEINLFEDITKFDPNLAALINDFESLAAKENDSPLIKDMLKLNNLIGELGEDVKVDDNAEAIKKLTNIIGMLEEEASKGNSKSIIQKFSDNFNEEIIPKGDMPFIVEQSSEIEAGLGEDKFEPELDVQALDLDKKDKASTDSKTPFNVSSSPDANFGSINSNTMPKAQLTKDTLEISRLITKPEDIIDVAVERFRSLRLPDRTELSVKLRPEELGEITVKLVLEKGQINGNIIAENRDVVNMLKSQIDFLKQEIKNSNVNLTSLNVNVSSDNLFDNSRGGKEFSQNNNRGSRKYEQFESLTSDQEEDGFTIMA